MKRPQTKWNNWIDLTTLNGNYNWYVQNQSDMEDVCHKRKCVTYSHWIIAAFDRISKLKRWSLPLYLLFYKRMPSLWRLCRLSLTQRRRNAKQGTKQEKKNMIFLPIKQCCYCFCDTWFNRWNVRDNWTYCISRHLLAVCKWTIVIENCTLDVENCIYEERIAWRCRERETNNQCGSAMHNGTRHQTDSVRICALQAILYVRSTRHIEPIRRNAIPTPLNWNNIASHRVKCFLNNSIQLLLVLLLPLFSFYFKSINTLRQFDTHIYTYAVRKIVVLCVSKIERIHDYNSIFVFFWAYTILHVIPNLL